MNDLKINFLARAKNKLFWMALIPALFLLVQMVAAIFGFNFDLSELQGRVVAAVDALFAVLVIPWKRVNGRGARFWRLRAGHSWL